MNKKTFFSILFGALILPSIVLAQLVSFGPQVDFFMLLYNVMQGLWILFTAICVIGIAFAGFTFLTANGAPEKLAQAKSAILWGVVGVAIVILSGSVLSIVGGFILPPSEELYCILGICFSVVF
jgi:hypothetical protein